MSTRLDNDKVLKFGTPIEWESLHSYKLKSLHLHGDNIASPWASQSQGDKLLISLLLKFNDQCLHSLSHNVDIGLDHDILLGYEGLS